MVSLAKFLFSRGRAVFCFSLIEIHVQTYFLKKLLAINWSLCTNKAP
jgi:hypothetical protein